MEKKEIKDGQGIKLHEEDRVYTHDFHGNRVYGSLRKGETFLKDSPWYVTYDDGEECIVLDFSDIYKA